MTENREELFFSLNELLEARQYTALMHRLDEINPMDAAEFLDSLDPSRVPFVFRLLKKDTAALIFAELEADLQEDIIAALSDREMGDIMEELATDDAVDLLEEMPASVVKRILRATRPVTRELLNRFLAYPEDSAGSVMTSELIDLRADMTREEAVEHIRRTGIDKETVYVAYVTDSKRILQGVVGLRQLLFAAPEDRIEDLMNREVVYAYTHDDRETVADQIARYDLIALPIVDKEGRLVGIVTVDDALDVLEEETTEDIEKMAAILPTDKPYLKTGVLETCKKRVPWLLLLMLSATFTSSIILHYENAIGAYAILAAFFPMLMGTGGNAGGQSSVTMIRALSLGEIRMRDIGLVLWKELRVSLICGTVLAAVTFLKVFAFDFRFQTATILDNGVAQDNLMVCLIVALTVLCAVVVAKLVGALLPIGAKRLGLDPAVMASPFVTTVVDTVTLLLYFQIASSFLPI